MTVDYCEMPEFFQAILRKISIQIDPILLFFFAFFSFCRVLSCANVRKKIRRRFYTREEYAYMYKLFRERYALSLYFRFNFLYTFPRLY